MTSSETPTAALLIIGNEILSGRTQDSNLNYLAKKLTGIGIKLAEARVVPDIEAEIVAALNAVRTRYNYVFTTGGIGGTHDDITADSVAKAFNVPVIEHPDARAILEKHYTPANLNAARLRMARMPEGASLITNPVSTAPGFRVENVYVMAGVPSIMKGMLDGIVAQLKHGPAIYSISVSGSVPENVIAEELTAIAESYPQLDIGSYPWFRAGRWGTALVTRGTDQAAVKKAADEVAALMSKHDSEIEIEISLPGAE
jgi:molybdenum cofactor synthesis domain-containing protein